MSHLSHTAKRAKAFICIGFLVVFWFSWGCPAKLVNPGDGGEGGGLSDGLTSDGVGPDGTQKPDLRTTPERTTPPEVRTEPAPELQVDTPPEVTPEPQPEPRPEPRPEASPDTPPEATPEVRPETGPEANPEVAPDTKPKGPEVGDPCKTDADCGGAPMQCIPEGKPSSFPFPQSGGNGPVGGYCTKACFIGSAQCPAGSECYVPGAASGTCLKSCKADAECRAQEGYTCTNDGGMQSKACFPPRCALPQADGSYWMNISTSRTIGTCAQMPMTSGSRAHVDIKINTAGNEMTFTFGSKPFSSLPVTWPLTGAYKAGDRINAANPKGCTADCDGLVSTRISNPCLFYATFTMKLNQNCSHSYDVSFTKK